MNLVKLVSIAIQLVWLDLIFATPIEVEQKNEATTPVQGDLAFSTEQLRKTPFPQWLTDFTGLTEWPGLEPPYIPLNFIDFDKIPEQRPYRQGHCLFVSRDICSFDCHVCLRHDDVGTCRKLSQTFDDGPSPASINLVDSLTHRSTFFVLGINTVNHPEVYHEVF